jgi:hypothetical protein
MPNYELILEELHNHGKSQVGTSYFYIKKIDDCCSLCRILYGGGKIYFHEVLDHEKHGISDDDIDRYNGYYENHEDILTQKKIKAELETIKNSLKDIDWKDIGISRLRNDPEGSRRCSVDSYTREINLRLDTLKGIIREIKDEETQDEFQELFNKILPEIHLELENFNRIHIIDGIPETLKDIGLGYKIYKALFRKFEYLSSDSYDANSNAKRIWDKIRKDSDYYTFLRGNRVLSIITDYKGIIDLLEKFYYNSIISGSKEGILIDPDFLKNLDVSKCLLKKII